MTAKLNAKVRPYIVRCSIFFRYAILAIPMVVAIKFEQFNIFATILGMFMIQLMILSDHVIAGVRGQ